jgi:hypothetical protein
MKYRFLLLPLIALLSLAMATPVANEPSYDLTLSEIQNRLETDSFWLSVTSPIPEYGTSEAFYYFLGRYEVEWELMGEVLYAQAHPRAHR